MPESLLSPSELKLFGRDFVDLKINIGVPNPATPEQNQRLGQAQKQIDEIKDRLSSIADLLQMKDADKENFIERLKRDINGSIASNYLAPGRRIDEPRLGANNFLLQQILAPGARLARIYAFAYEGDLYFLPKPYVFLVHGEGKLVVEPGRYQKAPGFAEADGVGVTVDRWGVIAKIDRFADDVRVWDYDKEDFSLRIDIVSGPLSELALEPAMAGDSPTSRADMTSRAAMAMRAAMAGNTGGGSDMAARANLAVRHRFTR